MVLCRKRTCQVNNQTSLLDKKQSSVEIIKSSVEITTSFKRNIRSKGIKSTIHGQTRKRLSGLKAHVWKNFVTAKHYVGLSLFKIVLVVGQAFIFPTLMGDRPTYIPVTVVNNDNDILSNGFVQSVDNEIYEITFANSLADGMQRFKTAQSRALFHFLVNFTKNVFDLKYLIEEFADDDCNITAADFQFHVYSDFTDFVIKSEVVRELYNVLKRMRVNLSSFPELSLSSFQELSFYLRLAEMPFDKVFAGDGVERTQSDGLQVAEMLAFIFIMSLFFVAIQMQMEYKNGFLERSFVAGLTPSEMLLSFTVSAVPHAVIEAVLYQTIFVDHFVIPINRRGFTFVLQILANVSGSLGGLMLSALSSSKVQLIFFLLPTFFHTSILSGVVISSKTFPKHFRYFSNCCQLDRRSGRSNTFGIASGR